MVHANLFIIRILFYFYYYYARTLMITPLINTGQPTLYYYAKLLCCCCTRALVLYADGGGGHAGDGLSAKRALLGSAPSLHDYGQMHENPEWQPAVMLMQIRADPCRSMKIYTSTCAQHIRAPHPGIQTHQASGDIGRTIRGDKVLGFGAQVPPAFLGAGGGSRPCSQWQGARDAGALSKAQIRSAVCVDSAAGMAVQQY